MWTSIINHQNHHYSLIFYFIMILFTIIISCCFPYVSCYSNNSTTSSSPRLLCLPHQRSALLQFKHEFAFQKPNFTSYRRFCSRYDQYSFYTDIFESYPKMKFWKAEKDCCSWDGVTCDFKTGQVVGLDLANSWLQGPLHSNSSLFKLRQLQEINLSFNNFSFSLIPSEFGQLSRLINLNLSFSMFSGPIPSEISFLTNLDSLDLSSFEGYDETTLLHLTKIDFTNIIQNMTNLSQLHLHQVDVSSSIPESLANLTSLTSLQLGGCGLHGKFPENVFVLPKLKSIHLPCNYLLSGSLPQLIEPSNSLRRLALDYTNFSGELPETIGYLKSLNQLSLRNCNFVGPIPPSIWNLSELTYLQLSSNHFNGHELPSTLGNLAKLTALGLDSCGFSGEIPPSLGNLTRLEYFLLSNNGFSGPIPASLGNLKQLQYLVLSHNGFSGQIPSSLGNLKQLQDLILSNNSFSGQIPSSLGNLTELKFLDLSFNNLGGAIPSFLFMLSSLNLLSLSHNQFKGSLSIQNISSSQLEVLELEDNKLNGKIPQSMFKLVNLVYISLSNNDLSGTVELSKFAKLVKLQMLWLSSNRLSLTNLSTTEVLPKFQTLSLCSCNISEFPNFLKAQDQLESLHLCNNRIEDQIPNWLWGAKGKMKLDHLDLTGNKLHGALIVPPLSISYFYISYNNISGGIHPSFQKWSNLKVFDISNNRFGGTVPRWLCNFSSSLEALNLKRNNFEGSLHQMFTCGGMHNLKFLDLSHNQFQGQLPHSLVNCSELQILNLGHNMISDRFPFWLQNLPELQVLALRSNKFYGPIWDPNKLLGFVKLGFVDLAFNNFSGSLPSEYFRNWGGMMVKDVNQKKPFFTYLRDSSSKYAIYFYFTSLVIKGVEMEDKRILSAFTSIDLSNNKFDGEIPSSIGDLRALVALNLSSNRFTGAIPSSFGKMKELESLDLSNNKLTGRIPQQLADLSFLAYLNLSRNQLTGPIPQDGQLDTFPSSSFEDNPGLCGSQLSSKKCDAKETPISDVESDDSFTWIPIVMGYGCGLMVGFIIGYVTLFQQGPTALFWSSFMGRYFYARW
ncbi:receptor like protein 22-like [Ziziphus jujuba]|uniref:Receptor like protein 22-like n=1 Tax=Ziziphus jujuba TaxID=326968 RepID=A0ABM3IQQ8_ZIZJJ|nr:receptor like protein 22-like [Ziziphus jujuba]